MGATITAETWPKMRDEIVISSDEWIKLHAYVIGIEREVDRLRCELAALTADAVLPEEVKS